MVNGAEDTWDHGGTRMLRISPDGLGHHQDLLTQAGPWDFTMHSHNTCHLAWGKVS